jgi:RNA polymerase sigma factor (sigma-70 family)
MAARKKATDGGAPLSRHPPSEQRRKATDDLFQEHYNWLVFELLRNTEFARELVHEAYIKVLNSPQDPESLSNPKGFLWTVIRRTGVDMARREWRKPCLSLDAPLESSVDQDVIAERLCTPAGFEGWVYEAFEGLTDLQQQVFTLNVEDGLSAREIATELGISPRQAQRALTAANDVMKAAAVSSCTQGRQRK